MRQGRSYSILAGALCMALVVLALVCAGRAEARNADSLEGRKIVRVDIEAREGTRLDLIRQTIRTREGGNYSAKTANEDVVALYGLRRFRDVKVVPHPVEDGVHVVFQIKPLPKILKVAFAGELKLSDATLKEAIVATEGEVASPFQLSEDLRALRLLYHDKGYWFARIEREIVEQEKDVEIIYHIDAGSQLRVEEIRFEGNDAIPDDELKAVMEYAAEARWLGRGRYDAEHFPGDLFAIRECFRRKGYLDATVSHEVRRDEAEGSLNVIIRVEQGPLYTIDRIVIRGPHLYEPGEILDMMELREGEAFSREQLEKDLATIRTHYGRQGYVKASVESEAVPAEEAPCVTLRLRVTEGHPYYVNRVIVRGNWRTKGHVIRREVTLLPGDRVNTDKIEESKRRLMNTGLFFALEAEPGKEPVRITLLPADEPERTDVLVEVEEGSVGHFALGGGLSSSRGLFGGVRFRTDNFDALGFPRSWGDFQQGRAWTGGGQQLTISLFPGTQYSDYRVSWLNPSVWDSEYSVGFDVYWNVDYFEDYYDERRVGASVTVGRTFFKDLHVGLTPRVEGVRISDIDSKAPGDARAAKGSYLRNSLMLSAVYDKRDNKFLTTSGYHLAGRMEVVGGVLGGDVDYLREVFTARKWWTVWNLPNWGKHTVNVGGEVGFLQSTGSGSVPIFERFFIGGVRSIRGFRYRRVGPVGRVVRRQIGGEYELLLNAEYEAPLYRNYVRGVVFLDTGALERSLSDVDFDSLRVSTGVGLHIRLPFRGFQKVPLALYLAVPLRKGSHDRTEVFNFTIGVSYSF